MKTTWQMNALELQQHHAKQVEEITRMLDTATAPAEAQDRRRRGLIAGRSAAGDEQRLRAIPCIARGVAGAIPGTSPHKIR